MSSNYPDVTNKTDSNSDGQVDILVLFGPANPYFDMIHYTALVSLGTSIIISTCTLIYLIRTGKGNFSHWKMGLYNL